MNPAYRYGQKLAAEPWSVLRTGLAHGAISTLPGAALGGALGYATAPEDYTREQRLSRAGKGALIGGATTGLAGGGVSALKQQNHIGAFDHAKEQADRMSALMHNIANIGEAGKGPGLGNLGGGNSPAMQATLDNFPVTWAGWKL